MENRTNKRFLIIDGSALLATGYYGNLPPSIKFAKTDEEKEKHYGELLHTSTGIYTNGVYDFLSRIIKILQEQKPEYIAFCFDKSRESTFRRELYPDYKGTRKPSPKPLSEQRTTLMKALAGMGFKVFMSDRFEADDIAGSLVEKFKGTPNVTVTVMTKDADYIQLIDQENDVTAWMMHSGAIHADDPRLEDADVPDGVDELDEKCACEKYNLPFAKAMIDFKAIAGDSSDNIPGVKGVGPTTAQLLINKYHNIEALYADIDAKGSDIETMWNTELGMRKGNYKKLVASRENARLSKHLATIRVDIPLNYQLEDFITPINLGKMDKQLKKYEMESLRIAVKRGFSEAR